MNPTSLPIAWIRGGRGALGAALARELARCGMRVVASPEAPAGEDAFLFHLWEASQDASLPALVASAARARGLKHICMIEPAPAPTDALVAEDALRYLAAQRGASLAVLRAEPGAFSEQDLARQLAAWAVDIASSGVSIRLEPDSEDSVAELAPAPEGPLGYPPLLLVTGASGQIGRTLTAKLDEQGIEHRDIDIVPVSSASPFLLYDLSDDSDIDRLSRFCEPVTHVVHLASRISNAKDLAESYEEQFRLNVGGTRNLLAALPATARHIAFASTMTVYGAPRSQRVDEAHPLAPSCVYALVKLAAERYLTEYRARTGVPVARLRFTSAYGPGPLTERAIPQMISLLLQGRPPQIYGDGAVRRDYMYLDDLCAATIAASLREADGVFNVGTGTGTSAAELAQLLIRLTGAPVAPVRVAREQDAQSEASLIYDIGKMRRVLGFTPSIALEDGLRLTIQHFRSAQSGRSYDKKATLAH